MEQADKMPETKKSKSSEEPAFKGTYTFKREEKSKGEIISSDCKKLKKILRDPRNMSYQIAISQVDELSDNDKTIIEAVKSLPVNNDLLGILSVCNLPNHIYHAIDREGHVLQHYRSVDMIPDELKAGYLYFDEYPDCRCIEVYTHTICVVNMDGIVTVIDREA